MNLSDVGVLRREGVILGRERSYGFYCPVDQVVGRYLTLLQESSELIQRRLLIRGSPGVSIARLHAE